MYSTFPSFFHPSFSYFLSHILLLFLVFVLPCGSDTASQPLHPFCDVETLVCTNSFFFSCYTISLCSVSWHFIVMPLLFLSPCRPLVILHPCCFLALNNTIPTCLPSYFLLAHLQCVLPCYGHHANATDLILTKQSFLILPSSHRKTLCVGRTASPPCRCEMLLPAPGVN